MSGSNLLSVRQFAEALQIPVSTIRYYDTIGLLPAAVRGDNSYRYYSIQQITTANVISLLQMFGIPLGEIKKMMVQRSPELILSFIQKQIEKIDNDTVKLKEKKAFLSDLYSIIQPALTVPEDTIYIQELGEMRIIRGELNDYAKMNDFSAMSGFYKYLRRNYPHVQFHYPVWGIFSQERVQMRDWKWPDRYYICNDFGYNMRQKSLYAVGHTRCWYGCGSELYEKMLSYIDDNGFELCGDVYEEYPLNELCYANEQKYLMRLLMPVQKKQETHHDQ